MLFRKKIVQRGSGELIYQYADGTYLPDSSQPSPKDPTKYTPHKSTRYKNVVIGRNGTAAVTINGELKETDKNLPELYLNRDNCCGCTACYAICPTKAISMDCDEEGFLYPVVDSSSCIRCYKCLSVCAFKNAQKEKGYL